MDISNPRRILAVSLAECQDHLTTVLKELTGAYPESSARNCTLAGTTHELPLETPYYSARVPIWLDLIGVDERPEPVDDAPAPTQASESSEKTAGTPDKNGDSDAAGSASSATPKQWADAFLAEEAREVRAVLGGVMVVLDIGNESSGLEKNSKNLKDLAERQRDLVTHVGRLVSEGLGAGASNDDDGEEGEDGREYYDDSWDGVGLVIGMASRSAGPPPSEDLLADWEDACMAAGLEFVAVAPNQPATNEFGEKTGIPRVLEALQANDWNQVDGLAGNLCDESEHEDEFEFGTFQRPSRAAADGGDDDDSDNDQGDGAFDPESLDFGFDRSDFVGLREAIWQQANQTTEDGLEEGGKSKNGDGSGGEESIQAVERMMQKLLAARELGEGLPPDQRRRLAARAVGEVMREL